MNIVIIEDERLLADDLAESLASLLPASFVIVQLHSVKDAITYFATHPAPDLIFSDIQLGDGLTFDVLESMPYAVPVVFCTAFDEYAVNAFKTNGIAYILKPYTLKMLEDALAKYEQMKGMFGEAQMLSYKALMQLLNVQTSPAKAVSVLVYFQDKIMPVKIEEIALFYLENDATHLLTFSGKVYYPNKNLEELEKLTGTYFFRANRQVLICRKAIKEASSFFSRKLSLTLTIPFEERVTVSKTKIPAFLDWLTRS